MRNSTLWESTSLILVLILPTSGDQGLLSNTNSVHRLPKKTNLIRAVQDSIHFNCGKPQPRAYNLRDLMQGVYKNSAESPSYPVYVILNRCDVHTGCCATPDMSCSPEPNSIYYDDVEIAMWSLENKTKNMWIRVEQHHKCVCEISNINDRICQENKRPYVVIL